MAFGLYFSAGINANHSSGGQASLAVTATAAIGVTDLAVMLVAVDNDSTVQDADEGAVASVIDEAGNTWVKVAEITCTEGTGPADGVVCSVWYTTPKTPILVGNNVTANFATPRFDAAVSLAVWPFAASSTVAVHLAPVRSVVLNGDPDTLDIVTGGEPLLRLRAIASELKNSALLIPTPGPVMPYDGVVQQASGSATSTVGIRAEYLVSTTDAAPSHPTLFVADHASVHVAFIEVPPIAGNGALEAQASHVTGSGTSSSTSSGALVASPAAVHQTVAYERAAVQATAGGQAHKPWKFFAGDTWLMGFACVDQSGVPYDLTRALAIEWKLDDASRTVNKFTLNLGTGVSVVDPINGQVVVMVQPASTTTLPAADYTDQLRVTMAGVTMVVSFGVITAVAPLV